METKGNWKIVNWAPSHSKYDQYKIMSVERHSESKIADVCWFMKTDEENFANAVLLKSAPEMKEALNLLFGVYTSETMLSAENFEKIKSLLERLYNINRKNYENKTIQFK